MYTPKSRNRRIDPRQLHRDKAVQQPAAASGTISLVANSPDADFGHLRNDLERECITPPILLDNRRHHTFSKLADAFDQRALFVIENIGDLVEIAVDGRRRISLLSAHGCLWTCHIVLP